MKREPEVVVMARRIARERVKDELRKNGIAISLVNCAELARATNMLLQVCGEELLAEARARLNNSQKDAKACPAI